MRSVKNLVAILMVFALTSLSLSVPAQAQRRAYRLTDRQIEQLIRRVETRSDTFRTSLDASLDRSRIDGTRREDNINTFVAEFEAATDQLRARFEARRSVAADVQLVLDRAVRIDNFLRRNALDTSAQNDWLLVKTDLNALASAYNVTPNWNNRTSPRRGGNIGNIGTADSRLTGTYRLDVSRSDNPREAVERATNPLPTNQRERVYDVMLRRLEAPDQLAIERRGQNITIASSRAAQTSFVADGRERSEPTSNGRSTRVSSRLNGDQLVVTSTGFRESDFTVTFDPIDNGRSLRVTRRIYSDRLTQPVIVQNTYDRISDVAQFDIYNDTQALPDTAQASGDFIVRNGQTLLATLNTNLSTRTANDGDRFTMTVREPAEFEGATIEGTVSNVSRSGRVTGRSGMSLNFETIRLRNGQSYRFAGLVDTVRSSNGETVRVDNEGSVGDSNQTNRTIQRTAVGTAVGAIIGAIAGGGKGAAIGAVIGAGAGAGSVYVQGRDDLELLSGSEVTIRASAPNSR